MLFFYEILFVAAVLVAIGLGEFWNRTAAVLFLVAWFGVTALGHASFGARLAHAEGMEDDERRWFQDARDGLRHLRMLFGVSVAAALVWRLLAG